MSKTVVLSSGEIAADPGVLVREIQAGNTVSVFDIGRMVTSMSEIPWITQLIEEEYDEAEDMVSLRTKRTGVDNTVFISAKGRGRHAPRIKIAVDPPDSLNAAGKNVTMAIHDYKIIGEKLPTHVAKQARQFIERNRDTLLRYWNDEIDTEEMISQLK